MTFRNSVQLQSDSGPATDLLSDAAEWPMGRLGDCVTKIGSGSTPRGGEAVYVKNGVPLIRSMNVHFDGIRPDGLAFITEAAAEKLKNVAVQGGDVLLNITGASIGRVTTVPGVLEGARVNQHVCIIRPTPLLLPKFLAYFFATPVEQMRINQCQVGATRQALTKHMIEDWQVPLPPLKEQRQIVAEIEKQFTWLEVGLAALRRVQTNLKRYRAAVLKAACEGRLVPNEAELARAEGRSFESGQKLLDRILTERRQNWQGRGKYKEPASLSALGYEPDALSECWGIGIVEQLNESNRPCAYGVLQPGEDLKSGVPFVRVGDINDGKVSQAEMKHIAPSIAAQYPRTKLHGGELAITLVGAIGRTAVIPDSLVGGNTARAVGIIPLTKLVNPHWVEIWFRNPAKVAEMTGKSHEVARKTLNLEDVRAASVALPPLAEQTRIVAEVERRLSVVEELEAVVSIDLQRAKRLRGSILAVGFRSEKPAEHRPPKAKGTSALTRQPVKIIQPIISPRKKQLNLTAESLVETVRRNKGIMTPSDLCLASNVEEEVEGFFEVLRDCRDRGLLTVPSEIGAIIKLAKS